MPVGSAKFGLMAAAGGGADFVGAFGGIITQYVDSGDSKTYRTHTFRGSGKFYVPSGTVDVDYLIMAGGGGGASNTGGGGGAGGVLQNTSGSVTCTAQTYPIVVGTGGYGGPRDGGPVLSSGVSSSAFGLTAIGGGSGAGEYDGAPSYPRQNAATGGSGGGADHSTDATGAAGTAGQGNAGGDRGSGGNAAAGGGGAGAVGADSGADFVGGNGGTGDTTLIGITSTDSGGAGTITYAGGGGGGVYGGPVSGTPTWVVGTGGSGLGGNGGSGSTGAVPARIMATSAVVNTGSGGGGGGNYSGGNDGGDGSAGIVIIRYEVAA